MKNEQIVGRRYVGHEKLTFASLSLHNKMNKLNTSYSFYISDSIWLSSLIDTHYGSRKICSYLRVLLKDERSKYSCTCKLTSDFQKLKA